MSSREKLQNYVDFITNNNFYIFLTEIIHFNKDFYIFKGASDGENAPMIYMNVHSLSLLIKALLYRCPQAIYLSSIFNFFQGLKSSNERGRISYNAYTHSLTLYYLKMLERQGIVAIEIYFKTLNTDYTEEYRIIGNDRPKREKKEYEIWFYKLRDIKELDLDLIRKIERFLKIPKGMISYTIKYGKLRAQLNRHIIEEKINQSETDKQNGKKFQITKKNHTTDNRE